MITKPRLPLLRPAGLLASALAFSGAGTQSAHAQSAPPAAAKPTAQAADDDVELSVGAGQSAPSAPPPAVSSAELAELRAKLSALEATQRRSEATAAEERARAAETERARNEADATRAREAAQQAAKQKEAAPSFVERIGKLGLSLSGYLQAQYTHNQLSTNELLQGGTPINQDRFSIRRGRLRLKGSWRYVRTDFELDASNSRGPTTSVRRATAAFVLPNDTAGALPWLVVSAGLTEIPLGLELQQGQDDILFAERTAGSLALFAGPVDTGVKVESAIGPFRAQLAIMNGSPLDDRAGGPSALDPTKEPDYVGRLGVDTRPIERLRIAGGASFLTGTGFHPGTSATKSSFQWNDANGNGAFDLGEQVPVSGSAATPSKTFDRWALNVDLEVDLRTKLGETRLYAEGTLAQNLDRALYVADPVKSGINQRALLWYVALVQELTEWGFVGVRYDAYDPNQDSTGTAQGRVVPADASIATTSLIAGARLTGIARLTLEYDLVRDKLGRDDRGVPVDLKNDQLTLRVQGRF
jgi:hypothetical protein